MQTEMAFRLINKKKFILFQILFIFVNLFSKMFKHNHESQLPIYYTINFVCFAKKYSL